MRRSCISEAPCSGNARVNQDGVCEQCPIGYTLTADKRFCELKAKAPAPTPSAPLPPNPDGRRKDIGLVSIKPMDRLLNQKDDPDNIVVKVGCLNDRN